MEELVLVFEYKQPILRDPQVHIVVFNHCQRWLNLLEMNLSLSQPYNFLLDGTVANLLLNSLSFCFLTSKMGVKITLS